MNDETQTNQNPSTDSDQDQTAESHTSEENTEETPTPQKEPQKPEQTPTPEAAEPTQETPDETTEGGEKADENNENTETSEKEAEPEASEENAAPESESEEEGEHSEDGESAEETDEEADESILARSLLGNSKKTNLKTSIGKQAKNTGRNWYVIHTYSGYEDAVEKALRQRIDSLNMHDMIFDVIVPKESTITIKKGEHVTEKKRLFPGYVLVEMIVTDESWYVVRNTPNVTGFVGSGTIPVPVQPEEFNVIQKHLKKEEPKFKIDFSVGEQVIISDGPFKSYEGLIDYVDEKKGKLKVLVTIFGRETPVELDFVQVKKK